MPPTNGPDAMAHRIAHHYIQTVSSSRDDTWPMRSACRDKPDLVNSTNAPGVFKALATCADCPVIADCDGWVKREPEFRGVAAGRVFTDRQKVASSHER